MTFNINLSFENSPKVVASETKRVGEEEEEEEYVYVRHKPVIFSIICSRYEIFPQVPLHQVEQLSIPKVEFGPSSSSSGSLTSKGPLLPESCFQVLKK